MNKGFYSLDCKPQGMMVVVGSFTTNSTSAPDGVTGDVSSVVRDDVGDYTVTLKHSFPQAIAAFVQVEGNEPELQAKIGSTAGITSGTFTVHTFDEDDTSGISASADSDDKVINVMVFVRNTKLTTW